LHYWNAAKSPMRFSSWFDKKCALACRSKSSITQDQIDEHWQTL
jgi:hypothetical protein